VGPPAGQVAAEIIRLLGSSVAIDHRLSRA